MCWILNGIYYVSGRSKYKAGDTGGDTTGAGGVRQAVSGCEPIIKMLMRSKTALKPMSIRYITYTIRLPFFHKIYDRFLLEFCLFLFYFFARASFQFDVM